jgi:hypothetical protein
MIGQAKRWYNTRCSKGSKFGHQNVGEHENTASVHDPCTSVHLISFRYCRRHCSSVHWHSRSGSRDPSWHCLQQQIEHARRNQSSLLVQTGDVSFVDLRNELNDLRLRTGCGTLHCPTWALWSCCRHLAFCRLLF